MAIILENSEYQLFTDSATGSGRHGELNASKSLNTCIADFDCNTGHYEDSGVNARVSYADTMTKAFWTGDAGDPANPSGLFDHESAIAITEWSFSVAEEGTWLTTYAFGHSFGSHYDSPASIYLYDLTTDSLLIDFTSSNVETGDFVCRSIACNEVTWIEADHEYSLLASTSLNSDVRQDYDNESYAGFYFDGSTIVNVSEPSSLLLYLIGLAGMGVARRSVR